MTLQTDCVNHSSTQAVVVTITTSTAKQIVRATVLLNMNKVSLKFRILYLSIPCYLFIVKLRQSHVPTEEANPVFNLACVVLDIHSKTVAK